MSDLEPVWRAAESDDPRLRQGAALRLGLLPEAEIERVVALMLAEPDDFVRETLIWAIVARGSDAVETLVAALADPAIEHERVLHTLSKIGDAATVEAIVPHADDPDRVVAAKAWWALGRIGTPECLPPLVAHLGEGDTDRRLGLTRALLQFGPGAIPALVEALAADRPAVRAHAAEVLVRLADPDEYGIAERRGQRVAAGALAAADAVVAAPPGEVDEVLQLAAADPDRPRLGEVAAHLIAARAR